MKPSALLFLILAIAAEVAGTAGLKASEGFGRVGPSALALLGYALAFYFLAQSLRYIPLGVAYAIWSGLGTVGSVLLGLLIWKHICTRIFRNLSLKRSVRFANTCRLSMWDQPEGSRADRFQ